MSDEGHMRLRLGNANVTVPIYQTKARTAEIVEALTQRLKAIEATSDRIDTQAFALQLAFEFAVRAAEAERVAEEETRDMARAMDRFLASLRALVQATREGGGDDPPSTPEPPTNLTPFRA